MEVAYSPDQRVVRTIVNHTSRKQNGGTVRRISLEREREKIESPNVRIRISTLAKCWTQDVSCGYPFSLLPPRRPVSIREGSGVVQRLSTGVYWECTLRTEGGGLDYGIWVPATDVGLQILVIINGLEVQNLWVLLYFLFNIDSCTVFQ